MRATSLLAQAAIVLLASCGDRLSASGGSSKQDEPDIVPGAGADTEHPAAGLISVVPGPDTLRIDWREVGLEEGAPTLAVFVSESLANLYAGPPLATDPPTTTLVVGGLAADTLYFVGIGLMEDVDFEPAGLALRARTGAPIYADPESSSTTPDGLTPATAYPEVFTAILKAFSLGGGNVWLAEGVFDDVEVPLFDGVHLYGGFPAGFDLAARDPIAHATFLLGRPGQSVISLQAGVEVAVIDGLALDGLDLSPNGIDLDEADVELRSITVGGCDRGVKLRADDTFPVIQVSAVHCTFIGNAVGGLSLDGAFDLLLEDCLFAENQQEGIDADDLIAPKGGSASFTARDCVFADNGAEGVDIDLGAPLITGPPGGTYEVLFEDCEFERNVGAGLLMDLDYELAPEWSAAITIRGCRTRSNFGDGLQLDLDARASAFVHRLTSSANRGDGLLARSESFAGMVTVSASSLIGNLGVGVRSSEGNFGVVLSHCVLAGNLGGGSISESAPSIAVSSVAYLQPAPWTATELHFSVESEDAVDPPFANVPAQFVRVTSAQGADVELDEPPSFGPGALCEVADDGIARVATGVGAATVTLDPAPAEPTPTMLAYFSSGTLPDEDYLLSASSVALGAGMTAPSEPPVDAGIFGSPSGGAPGVENLIVDPLFRAASTEPAWALPIAATQELQIAFEDGDPDPTSLNAGVFAFDALGQPVPIDASVVGHRVVVSAPGGWADGMVLELHPGLSSTAGLPLGVPIAFPLRAAP